MSSGASASAVSRKALKDEAVNSGAALEVKLQAVFSSNDRINRTQERLVRWVDRKCAVPQASPNANFPGVCGEGPPAAKTQEG
jgi:hypothetical protein